MFKNSKFLDLGIQFFSIKSKLKQLIRFVSSIDTVEYNAKKRSSVAVKLSENWLKKYDQNGA